MCELLQLVDDGQLEEQFVFAPEAAILVRIVKIEQLLEDAFHGLAIQQCHVDAVRVTRIVAVLIDSLSAILIAG